MQFTTLTLTSSTDLLPGPFILLLLLPSIPLLLFSIGARPPDTSALPFSSTEVFTTAAFVSVAGAVVLCLAVWPDVGRELGGFVRGGKWGSGSGNGNGREERYGQKGQRGKMRQKGRKGQSQAQGRTRDGGLIMKQNGRRMGQSQYIGSRRRGPETFIPRTQSERAMVRLIALRETFPQMYNPYRPHLLTSLFVVFCVGMMFFFISGHVLRTAYAAEPSKGSSSGSSKRSSEKSSSSSSSSSRSSGGSKEKGKSGSSRGGSGGKDGSSPSSASQMTPWVMQEIKYRQSESDDPNKTIKRVAEDAEKEKEKLKKREEQMGEKEFKKYREDKAKERQKEIDVLREQLKKLNLLLVGIPEKTEGECEGGDKDKEGKDKKGGSGTSWFSFLRGKGDGDKNQEEEEGDSGKKKKAEKKEKPPVKERLKKAFFLDAYDTDRPTMMDLVSFNPEQYAKEVEQKTLAELESQAAKGGPGWTPADPVLAQAAMDSSTANAQRMAEKMKKG